MNAFTVTGEFLLNGADKAQEKINKTTKVASSASNKMNEAFKKVGATIASVFAVKKIVEFGASLTKASAEVNAEMSALQQIMGSYTDLALEKLNQLAKSSGVTATKMTPYLTSLTAKFKGLGLSAEDSLNKAVEGLTLVTDASAFWDKSLDETNSALNSFINGNYEGGQSIGLFANETELASYAMKQGIIGATSEFSKLSNQQKQLIRLDFAKKMMEQSGVIGQSAKESQQYAVQMGNLTEKWRQFKALIGEPILEKIVLPAIKKLNGLLDTLTKKWEDLNAWIEENQESVLLIKDAFELAGVAVAGFIAIVGSIKLLSGTSKALLSMFSNPIVLIIAGIVALVAMFVKAWNTNEEFRTKVTSAWNTLKSALEPVFSWIGKAVSDFVANLPAYKETIGGILGNLWTLVQELWIKLEPVFVWIGDKWTDIITVLKDTFNNVIVPVISGIIQKFIDFKDRISEPVGAIVSAVMSIIDSISLIVQSVTGVETAGGIVESVLDAVQIAMDGVVWFYNNVLAPLIQGIAGFIKESIEPISGIVKGVFDIIGGLFNTLIATFKGDWDGAVAGLKQLWDGLVNTVMNALTVLLNAIKAIIQWDKLQPWLAEQWQMLKDTVVGWISGIGDWFSGIFDDMKNIGKNLIDGLIGGITAGWDTLKDTVSSTGKKIGNWFKDLLGIHSPSTVFEAFGKFLTEGLGIGIEEGSDDAEGGLGKVIDSLLGMLKNNTAFQSIAKSLGFDISGWVQEGVEEGTKEANADSSTTSVVPVPDVPKTMNVFQKLGAKIKNWWKGIKAYTKNANDETVFDFKGTFENIGTALQDAINLYEDTLGGLFEAIQEYNYQVEQNYINSLQEQYDSLVDSHDKRLSAYEEETEAQKKELAKQYANGTLSYSDYVKKRKQLSQNLSNYEQQLTDEEEAREAELNKAKDDLARKQFEANKKTQIAQALMQASLAIVQCFSQLGPIAGAVSAIVVGATTAVEIATIKKQEYVSAYAKGGIVDEPTVGLVGEDGKEAIVPLERNLEWTNSLAKAIAPAVENNSASESSGISALKEEIRDIRMMLADYLTQLVDKDSSIVISPSGMAVALAPAMDVQLGKLQKRNARR